MSCPFLPHPKMTAGGEGSGKSQRYNYVVYFCTHITLQPLLFVVARDAT